MKTPILSFYYWTQQALLPATSLLTLALVAGCNLAPHYKRPDLSAPDQFKENSSNSSSDPTWKVARPQDDRLRAKWWELFEDQRLNALEEKVQTSNQTLAADEASYRAARSLVLSARSAYFPTVSLDPAFSRSRTSRNLHGSLSSATADTGGGGVSTEGTINEFSLPAEASYTIDLWGRVRNNVAVAAYTAQASAADLATAQLSLQAELATDYYEVRALDTQRGILAQTVKSNRQVFDLTTNLVENGIDSDEDVAQARAQLDTSIAQETDVGVARAQYEHAIAVLIGTPPARFSLTEIPFEEAQPPAVPLELPSALLERRPDISAAERRVQSANAQIGVTRAAYYPNFTLSAEAGFESSSLSNLIAWPSRFWSVGPQLAMTIFDGGARRAQNEQAWAQYDQAVANYRQTTLTAFQAVEDGLAAQRILAIEAKQQQTAVQSAQRFYDLALTRFQNGIDSELTLTTAENLVLNARQAYTQIQLRQFTSSVSLIMSLGGGWDVSELKGK